MMMMDVMMDVVVVLLVFLVWKPQTMTGAARAQRPHSARHTSLLLRLEL
jgi:hypothetical protein